jgi:hypothetical protein
VLGLRSKEVRAMISCGKRPSLHVSAPFALMVAALGAAFVVGCAGSQTAPEQALLRKAVDRLEGTMPAEKRCETLYAALSRDLSSGKIDTEAMLVARQGESRVCFVTVRTKTRAALPPLRKILKLNGISEWKRGQSRYTTQQVTDMPVPVAAAYVLTGNVNGLNGMIGEAVAIVDDAHLGAPLGVGEFSIGGEEPAYAVYVLLSLEKHRKLLANVLADAREVAED